MYSSTQNNDKILFTAAVLSYTHHAVREKQKTCLLSGCPGAFGQHSAMHCASRFSRNKSQLYFFHIRGPVSACNFSVGSLILVHKSFLMCFKVLSGEDVPVNLQVIFIQNIVYSLCTGLREVRLHFNLITYFQSCLCIFSPEYVRVTIAHNKIKDKIHIF